MPTDRGRIVPGPVPEGGGRQNRIRTDMAGGAMRSESRCGRSDHKHKKIVVKTTIFFSESSRQSFKWAGPFTASNRPVPCTRCGSHAPASLARTLLGPCSDLTRHLLCSAYFPCSVPLTCRLYSPTRPYFTRPVRQREPPQQEPLPQQRVRQPEQPAGSLPEPRSQGAPGEPSHPWRWPNCSRQPSNGP